jgi:hypothetical protein
MPKTVNPPERSQSRRNSPASPRTSSEQTTLTLKFTRTEAKPIRRVKEWEERSASKSIPLTK